METTRTFVSRFRLSLASLAMLAVVAAFLTAEEEPASPTGLRDTVRRYLSQKTGKTATGAAVPKGSPWVWCAEQYEAVPKQDPKVLYGLIAEHLAIAEKRFLQAKTVEDRRKGLGMVSEACQCAGQRLKDDWLAVQICEGYLIPNLEAADDRHWKYLGRQQILETIADVYAQAKDADKFIRTLQAILENAHNRNTADAARLRLAQMLDKQGKYQEALRYLKEIDEKEGVGGARKLIPEIEKKLKAKK